MSPNKRSARRKPSRAEVRDPHAVTGFPMLAQGMASVLDRLGTMDSAATAGQRQTPAARPGRATRARKRKSV